VAIDPVCGMTVDEETAAGSIADVGVAHYFCSTDCLNQFAAKLENLARLKRDSVPIGTISEIHGPVVDVVCDHLPPLHQALFTSIDHEAYTFEALQHLDERHVRAITLNKTSGLRRGMTVYDTGASLRVPVSPKCLGRLLNVFGQPLDLIFTPFEVASVTIAVLAVGYVSSDGESNWMEGVMLLGVYLILAIAFYFLPA